MTDATFQPSLSNNQNVTARTANSTQLAVSFFRFLLSGMSAKRPVNADSVLAAQNHSEVARRSVDNLLR